MRHIDAIHAMQAAGYAFSTASKYVRDFVGLETDPSTAPNPEWTPTTLYQYTTSWRACIDVLGPDAHAALRGVERVDVTPIRLSDDQKRLIDTFLADHAPTRASTYQAGIVRAIAGDCGAVDGPLMRRFANWCRDHADVVPLEWAVPIRQWVVEPLLHLALAHLVDRLGAPRLVAAPAWALELERCRFYTRQDRCEFFVLDQTDVDAGLVLRHWANHCDPDAPLVPLLPYSSRPMGLHGLRDLVKNFGPAFRFGPASRRRPTRENVSEPEVAAAPQEPVVEKPPLTPPGTPPPIGANAPIVDPYAQQPDSDD